MWWRSLWLLGGEWIGRMKDQKTPGDSSSGPGESDLGRWGSREDGEMGKHSRQAVELSSKGLDEGWDRGSGGVWGGRQGLMKKLWWATEVKTLTHIFPLFLISEFVYLFVSTFFLTKFVCSGLVEVTVYSPKPRVNFSIKILWIFSHFLSRGFLLS